MAHDKQLFSNNAISLLRFAIGPSATTLQVLPGDGGMFPNPGPGEYFLITLENQAATVREIIRVNGRSGDTLTGILRAQEGTTAQSWGASPGNDTLVDHRVTAETMRLAMILPEKLGDLEDVDTTGAVNGNVLKFNGTQWVPGTDASGSGTVTSVGATSTNAAITVVGSPITTSGVLTFTSNVFTSSTPGHVPASGGGTTNFLRADGTWAAPPGGGGSGTVTSIDVSGGTTGLTTSGGPVTTAGTITLGGVLDIAHGGTGQTTADAALNALLPDQSGNAGKVLSTDGSTTSWVAVGGSGTVTSVGLSAPSFMTVGGSPVTAAGTLTLTLANQTARTFFVGPLSGSAAPTFRTVGLDELSDVDTTTTPPTSGQVLTWDGTTWVPQTGTGAIGPDLTAIEALTGVGYSVRTATNTWALRTILGEAGRIVVTNGNASLGNTIIDLDEVGTPGTYTQVTTDAFGRVTAGANPTTLAGYGITDAQPLDPDLTAIANLVPAGFITLTGAGTAAARTIEGTAGVVTVGNGDGIFGNPVINLDAVGSPGTYGNATNIPVVTTDVYGRVTNVTLQAVNFPVTSVHGRTGAVVAAEGDYSLTQLADVLISAPVIGQQLHYVGGNWENFTPPDYLVDPGVNGIVIRTGLGVTTARITTGGTGISVTNGDGLSGDITITNTGVTSVAGTAGQVNVSAATGAVTFSVGTELAGLAALSTNGLVIRTGAGTYTTRTLSLYSENAAGGLAVATGSNAVAIGDLAQGDAERSLAIGAHAVTRVPGAINMAAGRIQSSGDAQTGTYIMKAVTTNALSKELFMDGPGGTQRVVLADDSTWMFTIHLAAHRTDDVDGHAGFFIKGVVYRGAGAATVALQGVAHKEVIARSNASWDVNIGVNTADGGLQVLVTGEAGKTIRWLARIETVELTN